MLRLSALALGPLLARAAPKIGSGNVDNSTIISQWLSERYSDLDGKLVKVLTRVADRAWRALEIALAGEELHRSAGEAGVDRALVEQIRQFIAIAALPPLTPKLRQQILFDIQKARQAEIIPGPTPSSNALAAIIIRYLGTTEESREIDANELIELGLELRIAGYGALAGFFELCSANRSTLLITAVRYFLSREIAEDLRLLRDLRYMRVELLSDALRTGFDRLADALDRFTTVLSELLTELTTKNALRDDPASSPAPDKPKILEPGFAILGEHLIAPIRTDTDGLRIAPCPVCLTNVRLTPSVGAWVSLNCTSCGTEFQATDGSTPPPPPPPVFKIETTRKPPASQLAKNLQLWINSGSPLRWIEFHKGMWDELEFVKLKDQLCGSYFWPLELTDVRKILNEMAYQYRIRTTSSVSAPKATSTSSSSGSHGLIKTTDVYRTIDGNLWVPCPLCRSFNVEIPPRSSGEVSLTCSGCWRMFLVDLKRKSAAILPPPAPPSSSSVWRKIRNWFGS